ncbi:aminoglycoside phosphotransferase, partial [Cereibacter changlensis]
MSAPDRQSLSAAFLQGIGWGAADRRFLAGDASDRRYDRLTRGQTTAVLMDAPPGQGDDSAAFVAIDRHLRGLGLSAPEIFAEDLSTGFLLLEDLGDALYARRLATATGDEAELYAAATDVLLHLQRAPAPPGLPDLTAADWAEPPPS